VLLFVLTIILTLKESKISKQGPAGKRINITSIPQKLEIIRRLKKWQKQRLWHHTIDCELSMIQRNRRTKNDHLQHPVKVWRTFSCYRH